MYLTKEFNFVQCDHNCSYAQIWTQISLLSELAPYLNLHLFGSGARFPISNGSRLKIIINFLKNCANLVTVTILDYLVEDMFFCHLLNTNRMLDKNLDCFTKLTIVWSISALPRSNICTEITKTNFIYIYKHCAHRHHKWHL